MTDSQGVDGTFALISLGLVARLAIPALRKLRQRDQKFKACSGCRMSSRLALVSE